MADEPSLQDQLMRMILSKWISKPIYVAAELGIADLVADGPRSIGELAGATETRPEALYRLMRALASVGIFSEQEDRRFGLTPMAGLLRDDSLRAAARTFNSEWNDRAWIGLLEGVRSGANPFEAVFGCGFGRWIEANPREAAVLQRANAARAGQVRQGLRKACDFSRFASIVDLGGGYGTMLLEILSAHPRLKGAVADLPPVVAETRKRVEAAGLCGRCAVIECDLLRSVPPGGDAYLLANVLHDWPDEKAAQILENCRRAMDSGSTLLIVEMLVPPGNNPSAAKLLDLEMFVVTGGRERTEQELRSLLQDSGLSLSRLTPAGGESFVLEAVPGAPR